MKILYNFPSRERPYKFFNCLDNIINKARHDDYEIVATLDTDDMLMNNDEVKKRLDTYENVRPIWGTSRGKVSAINRSVWFVDDWDVCITMSDDFWILNTGFDTEVLSHYQNGFSGLLHYPDGHANERLCTFPILDRAYYNKFNFIYNPIFQSVYCDNWQHEVAVLLGKYKYVDQRAIEHRHPIWGFGIADDLVRRNEHPILYARDYAVYTKQKELNYEIERYQ
jgi:hypothetical protein